ncbi:PqqD family protein [Companilactobacillus metriopterae]|uniref:PqqD family protein n=1 Tax=Companilactobacillus metriopterae TaxID=1909267 RepID=UPI00100AB9E2|nr:PqqD family protein [Companilactobacillus metriopterae]
MLKKNFNFMIAKIDNKIYISDGTKLFETNSIGADIYKQVNGKRNILEITSNLSQIYDVSFEELSNDIKDIIYQYLQFGILKETN